MTVCGNHKRCMYGIKNGAGISDVLRKNRKSDICTFTERAQTWSTDPETGRRNYDRIEQGVENEISIDYRNWKIWPSSVY